MSALFPNEGFLVAKNFLAKHDRQQKISLA